MYAIALLRDGPPVFCVYMFCVVGERHAHNYFEVISIYNRKDI